MTCMYKLHVIKMYSRFKIKYARARHICNWKYYEQFYHKYNKVSVYSFYNFSSVSFGKKNHFMISVLENTKMIKSSWKPFCGPLSLNFYNAFLWRRSLLSLTLMGSNTENLSFFWAEYLYFVMRINHTNLIFSFIIFIEEIYIFNKNERFYSFFKMINNLFFMFNKYREKRTTWF
jgi:hypothetical protein